jgi:hypothetical protein
LSSFLSKEAKHFMPNMYVVPAFALEQLERENAALRAEALKTQIGQHAEIKNYAARVAEMEKENAALKNALDAQIQYQSTLRADRDRMDWMECLNQLPIRNKGKWVGWDNETYPCLRKTIDAARNHHVVREKEVQP